MIACKNEMRRYTWAFPTKCGSLSSITNKSYNLSNHLINHFSSKTQTFSSYFTFEPITYSIFLESPSKLYRLRSSVLYWECKRYNNNAPEMSRFLILFSFFLPSSVFWVIFRFFGCIEWREKKSSSHKFHRHLELFRTNYNIYARIFVSRSMHWRMRYTTHKH